MKTSNTVWLEDHYELVDRFLEETGRIEDVDKEFMWVEFLRNPSTARSLIEDYYRDSNKKFDTAINLLCGKKSVISIIHGCRGSGKTALAYRVAWEAHQNGRQVFFYMSLVVPEWAKRVFSLNEVPDGAFVIIDEGSIFANSRDFENTSLLLMLLPILRHRDISTLFIVQSSGDLDKKSYRQVDVLLFCEMGIMSDYLEREGVLTKLDAHFLPDDVGLVYLKCKNSVMQFKYEMIEGYEEKYSKTFKKIEDEETALAYSKGLATDGCMDFKGVGQIMSLFGWYRPPSYWKQAFEDWGIPIK